MSYMDGDLRVAGTIPLPREWHRLLCELALGAIIGAVPGAAFAAGDDDEAWRAQAGTARAVLPTRQPDAVRGAGRDYGPSRPGMGVPASTIEPGHVSIETALVDWQRDDRADARVDTLLVGSTSIRIGLNDRTEMAAGWTPFGRVRVRAAGATEPAVAANGTGDLTLGLKQNLRNPDGGGLSIAMQPFVVLPVGRAPIGSATWGTGAVMPVSYELSRTVTVQLTPEIDAAPDDDGPGRHIAYSLVCGMAVKLAPGVQTSVEIAGRRDLDPSGHTVQTFAGAALGWAVDRHVQVDVGGTIALDRHTPDGRLYAGISRRI